MSTSELGPVQAGLNLSSLVHTVSLCELICVRVVLCLEDAVSLELSTTSVLRIFLSPLLHRFPEPGGEGFNKDSHLGLRSLESLEPLPHVAQLFCVNCHLLLEDASLMIADQNTVLNPSQVSYFIFDYVYEHVNTGAGEH